MARRKKALPGRVSDVFRLNLVHGFGHLVATIILIVVTILSNKNK